MLCTVFASRIAYLERTNAMRLDLNPARSIRRARKAYGHALAEAADATASQAAKRRADRRANAARRAMREAERSAWDLDFGEA